MSDKIKTFAIEALSTARDKVTLDAAVDKAVNSFLGSEDATIKSVVVNSELQGSGFGKAFVIVSYESSEKAKKK